MQFRHIHHLLVLATLVGAVEVTPVRAEAPAARYCAPHRVTGYVRSEGSPWTYDGTSIYTDEPIAAASWNIPIGAYVWVEGWGTYRVADRGILGNSGWIDIAVWDRPTAYQITGVRTVCVVPPEEAT